MAGYIEDPDFASDPNFNWETGGDAGATAVVANALDFVIPGFESGVDVQGIEDEQAQRQKEWEEKRFQTAPIGRHLFEIVEFLKPPELTTKQGYAFGKPATYEAYKVTVKFAIVGRPNFTILKYMELPPAGKDKVRIYQNFMKNENGKVAGWFSRELEQLLRRIGYAFETGQPIPASALAIKNWIGKQVYATVEKGDGEVRYNPSNGEAYPVSNQFKSFSFQEAESTIVGNSDQAAQGRPASTGNAGIPPGAAADRFVKNGLANV